MAIVTAFRPLVMKLAGQEKRTVSAAGSGRSTLVLGILEAIKKYPGEDARRFPGFVKTHLTFLLSHYIRKQARWNKLKEKLMVRLRKNYIEDFTLWVQRRELQDAFLCLAPDEQWLVYLAAGQRIPWKTLGEEFGSPVSTLYGHYQKALKKVRKKLKDNGTGRKNKYNCSFRQRRIRIMAITENRCRDPTL